MGIIFALIGCMLPDTLSYDSITDRPSIDLQHGLVLWLPFDAVALDKSGFRGDGVVSGAVYVGGVFNQGLEFDGVDDSVEVSDSDVLDDGGFDFTISCWVTPHNASKVVSSILNKRDWSVSSNAGWQIQLQNSRLYFYWCDGSGARLSYTNTSFYFYNGVTYFVVFTREGDYVRFIVDDVEIMEYDISTRNGAGDNALGIIVGGDYALNPQNFFDGFLDDVRVYNRALSSYEINELYNLNT